MRSRWRLEEEQKKKEPTPKKEGDELPAVIDRTAHCQESEEEPPGEGPGKAEAVEKEDEIY
jgi:hypothetical protein